MKVVQLNTICGNGSTGKICVTNSKLLTGHNIENYIFYNDGICDYPLARRYMSHVERKIEALKARLFGNFGFNSKAATKRLLKQIDIIAPDVIHLHNLHGNNVHLGILFEYLRRKKTKIFWTFHDCWAFTGYCSHYDMIGCKQWEDGVGCKICPKRQKTSWFFDRSKYLYEKKKSVLSGLNMTIITPSQWLATQVRQSFLSEYEIKVIENGIELSTFYPQESSFRERNNLENKYIVLGVAHIWCAQKGTDVFIELAKRLDERFQIVLVGTNDDIDKQLPENIISIHRTQNQTELAEIYTAADVFVNPTREEVLGLTNIEALACGTPVITFKTGGSPECIDNTCGIVVEKNDVDALEQSIVSVCCDRPFTSDDCVARARKFSAQEKFDEYIQLYKDLM